MAGTLSVSWGRYGGFYVRRTRLCLGWIALTYVPVEIDALIRSYTAVEAAMGKDCVATIRAYLEIAKPCRYGDVYDHAAAKNSDGGYRHVREGCVGCERRDAFERVLDAFEITYSGDSRWNF